MSMTNITPAVSFMPHCPGIISGKSARLEIIFLLLFLGYAVVEFSYQKNLVVLRAGLVSGSYIRILSGTNRVCKTKVDICPEL